MKVICEKTNQCHSDDCVHRYPHTATAECEEDACVSTESAKCIPLDKFEKRLLNKLVRKHMPETLCSFCKNNITCTGHKCNFKVKNKHFIKRGE